jgi:ribosomal protein S18 acetylase RimI-like enzyme
MGEILVARNDAMIVGWLRYGYLWDEIPFMNMLVVQEPHRRRSIGAALVTAWEDAMRTRGHTEVLTSTQANEQGQFFYRKLGSHDCGALLLPSEALEILMRKAL